MPLPVGDVAFYVTVILLAPHLALALAAAGMPVVSASGGFFKTKRIKIFLDKFGQQTTTFALLGGGYVFLLTLLAAVALPFAAPESAAFFFAWPLPVLPLAAPLFFGAILFLVYRGLWQRMKNSKSAHSLIGIASGLAFFAALYALVSTFRLFSLHSPLPLSGWDFFVPPQNAFFWPILLETLTLALCLAGGCGGLYLVARRNKDDFGRDYYGFTLKLAARWAFFAGLVHLATLGHIYNGLWPFATAHAASDLLFWSMTASLALWALALALWGITSFSSYALRMKWALFTAAVLAVAALACQSAFFWLLFFG
ncbi:hypothetical protein G3N56_05245 [Desulfovibrio sulfodismutans]|uniref:Uncharacterized protein n=1 Tax=Desulfolutivibrio sulfodismutans TaxID=63561 RepID=A0A7K3NIW7_9BACT|nr:hypothetical protein [Desulfolutivibrio sulfodismutans]NDY56151.1 hypothetical protein [Desulfolutivibrio sulfodismutans]QLA13202.1 hypothetical protein GD606_13455 [Desulfolutivibrio sulfodismutans DSM 3696]